MNGRAPGSSQVLLHASCVAIDAKGVLITGASGRGKSTLALALMALGADLVADDRTLLERDGDDLIASAPSSLAGKIEARGLGILSARARGRVAVACVVDMDTIEADRLPPFRTTRLLDCTLPLLHRVESVHFPAAILQYVMGGRQA